MNTPCSVFKARYVFGVSLEDDVIALEAEGAFGILVTKGRMGLNMQDQVGINDALTLSIRNESSKCWNQAREVPYWSVVRLRI